MAANGLTILIVGGGFSGMAAAMGFARAGHHVDLVEIDAGWRSYGAGISLSAATLRAFKTLGIIDRFLTIGAATEGVDLMAPNGHLIGQVPTPRLAGPDYPGGAAVMRPALARLMSDMTREAGVHVRLGTSFTDIEEQGQAVRVSFTDGTAKTYDLVVGADGLYSALRQRLFPDAPRPRYTGQCVWRAVVKRPKGWNKTAMWLGPKVKTGVNPVNDEEMYLFVTEDRPNNDHVDPATFLTHLKSLLKPFPDPVMATVHDELGPHSAIVYRPLEQMLMPRPWFKGHVVLIGDAVHATTPHMASGACIGIEDAIVLVEEIDKAATITDGLTAFENRRWERCRMVVENSGRLGEIEVTGGDREEHARLMRETTMALMAPI